MEALIVDFESSLRHYQTYIALETITPEQKEALISLGALEVSHEFNKEDSYYKWALKEGRAYLMESDTLWTKRYIPGYASDIFDYVSGRQPKDVVDYIKACKEDMPKRDWEGVTWNVEDSKSCKEAIEKLLEEGEDLNMLRLLDFGEFDGQDYLPKK